MQYSTITRSFGLGIRVFGLAKHVGTSELGRIRFIVTLRDAGGKVVGTESDYEPGGRQPGELFPFYVNFGSHAEGVATIDFQTEVKEATDSEKRSYYRDYQVNDVSVQDASTYSGVTVLGTVKNVGSAGSNRPSIYVVITDDSGKVIDVASAGAELSSLNPGESSPFKVESLEAKSALHLQTFVFGERK